MTSWASRGRDCVSDTATAGAAVSLLCTAFSTVSSVTSSNQHNPSAVLTLQQLRTSTAITDTFTFVLPATVLQPVQVRPRSSTRNFWHCWIRLFFILDGFPVGQSSVTNTERYALLTEAECNKTTEYLRYMHKIHCCILSQTLKTTICLRIF